MQKRKQDSVCQLHKGFRQKQDKYLIGTASRNESAGREKRRKYRNISGHKNLSARQGFRSPEQTAAYRLCRNRDCDQGADRLIDLPERIVSGSVTEPAEQRGQNRQCQQCAAEPDRSGGFLRGGLSELLQDSFR